MTTTATVTAPRHRLVAIAAGLLCHASFAAGVGSMVAGLYTGLRFGLQPFTGPLAWVADVLLVLQFPLLHSWLLSRRGRRAMSTSVPYGSALNSTTFATISSLQLLAVFALWSPLSAGSWRPPGAFFGISVAAYAASWLFLGKAMLDANILVQTGALGWLSLFRGRKADYGGMPDQGTFKLCRQPIYLAFAMALWTAPVWTMDRLILALAWTAYCVVGPLHKEARFKVFYGEKFREYQKRVPYILPGFRSH